MTGQATPAPQPRGAGVRKCPKCGKPGASDEHVMWCDWQ